MAFMIKPLAGGLLAAASWPWDFTRAWLIRHTIRELHSAGGGHVIDQRGRTRLEVRIPATDPQHRYTTWYDTPVPQRPLVSQPPAQRRRMRAR